MADLRPDVPSPDILRPAVLCLTTRGHDLARRIADVVDGEVHGLDRRTDAAISFQDTLGHIRDLFAAGRPVIGICAAGILIRAVAPLLANKWAEPPVIAISEDGAHVIPLLGGHHGANKLAAEIAPAIYGQAAVTTAGDTRFGTALDEPPAGWTLANPEDAGAMAAAMLEGSTPTLTGRDAASLGPWLGADPTPSETPGAQLTDYDLTLSYYPRTLAIGVGCARHCPPEELRELVDRSLEAHNLSPHEVASVVSLDLKADEAAVLAIATTLDAPARFFTADQLEAEADRLANPSDVVFAEVGCHGVAEGAALAAAGADAELIVEKQKSANATVAIARAAAPIVAPAGRPRGQVSLIGLGPGRGDWRTPEASRLIAEADELVGYGFYIDLIGPLAAGKPRADFPLGGEADRCRYALEQAGLGRSIALICSGDAGIYAMGALVYELMDTGDLPDAARRVEVITAPGVTAMQAAAARVGAPLGHDFCAISLSDLLTPRADIERRVRAGATGDFVIAFYNPVSQRRRELFADSITVLRAHRPADTPVILARSLGRPEEALTLKRIDEVSVDEVDMMTVVIVGSSQSRRVAVGGQNRVYTPRGYAAKTQEAAE